MSLDCRASRRGLPFALFVAGCRGAAEPAGDEPPAHPEPERQWAAWSAVRSWEPVTREPFVSRGHAAARYRVEVRVSPSARRRYRELVPGVTMPSGTVVAKTHVDRRSGRPGPIYAMRKTAEDRWRFIVAEPDGTLVERPRVDLCRRCHAEAVADHLFGIPRDTQR